jgi:hypothetical protein
MGKTRNICIVFVEITLGKHLLGGLRRRWEVDITMICREVGSKDENWIRIVFMFCYRRVSYLTYS